MLGFLGTFCVIAQMATLSFGFSTKIAMLFGLSASILWGKQAMKYKDKWLIITNLSVAAFAIKGLI